MRMPSFGAVGAVALALLSLQSAASQGLPLDCNEPPPPRPDPAVCAGNAVTAKYFGVSTIVLTDQCHTIMVDGFFSRPKPTTEPIPVEPGKIASALAAGGVGRVDLLLVTHTHYDHALDSAEVARQTCARFAGSRSARQIARGENLPVERIQVIGDGAVLEAGQFKVEVYQTPHAWPEIFKGEVIRHPLKRPARLQDFKPDTNFSFLVRHPKTTVLIVPSGAPREGTFDEVKADVVFLGIGLLGWRTQAKVDAYWKEAVQGKEAQLVIPVHWDDFTHALGEGLVPMASTGYAFDMLRKANTQGIPIRCMKPFAPEVLPARRPAPPAGQASEPQGAAAATPPPAPAQVRSSFTGFPCGSNVTGNG